MDQVPRFALYGEEARSTDAEFIHIEDIGSRSSRYDWEIASHTHKGLFQLVAMLDGGARVLIDDRVADMVAPSAVIVPPAVVHGFRFHPGTHGYVLTVAEAVLFDGAGPAGRPVFEALFLEPCLLELGGDPAAAARIGALLDQLMTEFRWPQLGRTMMCEWLVRGILLLMERQRAAAAGSSPTDRVRAELFTRFRALVEERFTEHWPVPRYADALGITESRLNRLCRTLVDRSAFELVQDRLLLEARRRLIHIAAPVSLIAYELGFQDPAYFNRFFKKLTGTTPGAFRRAPRTG
ncbi:helix-turn-helix domain-containing protein [Azospirillum oleiclasticum]|uniref:helix-turn-helix domain-containing protein n=1 Tax=Azospirillum oleiclasticum TaxID=2735135 RepID=UPI0031B62BD3